VITNTDFSILHIFILHVVQIELFVRFKHKKPIVNNKEFRRFTSYVLVPYVFILVLHPDIVGRDRNVARARRCRRTRTS